MNDSNYFSRSREEMLKFLPKKFSNVLEIGCGKGEFGKLVKMTYNIRYTGVEADTQSALVAKEHLDMVLVGDVYEQLQFLQDNNFDLLVCNDILEHLSTPEILLHNLRIKMKSGAVFVCSVPNIRALGNLIHLIIHKDFEYNDWGIRDRTHLRFFTKKSIIRLLKDNDLKIEKIEGINPIVTFKTKIPLALLQLIGHGDTRFHQYGITATF